MEMPEERPSCLVVEDQALIGMAIEAYLEDAGFQVHGPVASATDAFQELAVCVPALVILDYVLKDGPCMDFVRELKRRGVPFVIYSGRKRDAEVLAELRDVPWLEKPADRRALLHAMAAAAPEVVRSTALTSPSSF